MRKTLPFTQPLAYGLQYHAFPLGILASYPQSTDWVLSNYLQLSWITDPGIDIDLEFYLYDYSISPWLETLKLNRDIVTAQAGGITTLVRAAIEADFYVYLTLNERYLPERLAYDQDTDYMHDPLIRGIDDNDDVFEIYGYDRDQVFRGTTIPQEDLAIAYHNTGTEPFYEVPVTLYRFKPTGSYRFDLRLIARTVVEYLESTNTSVHFQALRDPWDQIYGMATYQELENYLVRYARGEIAHNIQNLHTLWEHKRMMVARLTRCAQLVPDIADLVAPYQRVERMAWALRLMMLSHGEAPEASDFTAEAIPLLHTIRDADRHILEQFLAALAKPCRDLGESGPCTSP